VGPSNATVEEEVVTVAVAELDEETLHAALRLSLSEQPVDHRL
jgi:hypothetical protein